MVTAAIADSASIVLAALPYICGGALAAALARRLMDRLRARRTEAIALLALFNPGCDCALDGFAAELTRARPALAGFALTFAAAAAPISLAVTHATLGTRMTIVRAAGGALAAVLTAAAWNVLPKSGRVAGGACAGSRTDLAGQLASSLTGVVCCAIVAAACKAVAPAGAFAHASPAGAALLGALLSPCSASDPLLAAALLRDAHAQMAFMLAAQCLDVRQVLLVVRRFGKVQAAAAFGCAVCACALAAALA